MCCQSTPAAREEPRLGDFPPSVKLVYLTLSYEGPLTQKELVERTELASRTVRSALSELVETGFVSEELYLRDLRQRKYVALERPGEGNGPSLSGRPPDEESNPPRR